MILNLHVKFTGGNLADHKWLKALASREKRSMPQQMLVLIRQAQVYEARAAKEMSDKAMRDALLERLLAEQEARDNGRKLAGQ